MIVACPGAGPDSVRMRRILLIYAPVRRSLRVETKNEANNEARSLKGACFKVVRIDLRSIIISHDACFVAP